MNRDKLISKMNSDKLSNINAKEIKEVSDKVRENFKKTGWLKNIYDDIAMAALEGRQKVDIEISISNFNVMFDALELREIFEQYISPKLKEQGFNVDIIYSKKDLCTLVTISWK